MTSTLETYFDAAAAAIADERYGGSAERGFAQLAFQLSFPTYAFSDDQAEEATSVDRKGDLGADAVFVSDDDRRVLVFQSKSSGGLSDTQLHDEIAKFRRVLDKLVSDDWVEKAHVEMQSLANEFRTAVRKGYEVHMVFATRSPIAKVVRDTFPEYEASVLMDGDVQTSVQLLDAPDLEARYRKLLLHEYGPPTNVHFSFRKEQVHEPESVEPVVYLTLDASEFVKECKPHGNELFRYNPREYLGRIKVNREISQTLKNAATREYFHLLNNGVTAVCKDFTIVDAGDGRLVVNVDDFQVVNGCQTTMTLMENSDHFEGDNRCLVDVKIIKSEGLRNLISVATNTQTAVVAEDSFANEPEQKHIQEILERFDPRYFYAPKRGEWERLPTKNRYFDAGWPFGKTRKLTSKELASVFLAIFGEPEAAKDRPTQVVFERTDGSNSSEYRRIFEARNVAAQWLLPFELFRCISAQARQEAAAHPGGDRARIAQYGRYRILHLCYSLLAERASEAPLECMSATNSMAYLESIQSWGPRLAIGGLDAVVDAFEDAQARGESSGFREFFREKKHQKVIFERFQKVLANEQRSAERHGETIKERLELPI